jgi:energy-coupling factor transporter ATP-binding protein EcfA2
MTLVQVRDLRFGYRKEEVLSGLSLDIGAGEGVALLGHNGAGKTTLLRLLMAFHRPRSGSISIAGRSTAGLAPEDLAGTAGYLFQRPEDQLFRRSVRDDVAFGPAALGWGRPRVEAAVAEVLDQLELGGVAGQHPYDLPLPTRRLVALAGVLVADPKLLLLDEPTATLDRKTRQLVIRILAERRARGTALVAVTHDVGFALDVCDRGVILDGGVVRGDAPLALLLGEEGGIPLPAPHRLLRRLGLAPASPRTGDLVAALAERCRALR